jgi:hexosaminidase
MHMRHSQQNLMRGILALLPIALMIFSCSTGSSDAAKKNMSLDITWQLVSNFTQPAGFSDAKFIIGNKGGEALGDQGWAIFFNISPRMPVPFPTPQPAHVEHINGDWFKLVPDKGFHLEPGKTIEVNYRAGEAVIKETDAPLGMYIVYYGPDGKEKDIVDLGNARVLPFLTREQQLRGKDDQMPLQTPALDYSKNRSVSLIPAEKRLPIIPEPVKYAWGTDSFRLTDHAVIVADPGLENEAAYLTEKLHALTGLNYQSGKAAEAAIFLKKGKISVNGVAAEAYRLDVSRSGVKITGSDEAGVFYGIQSLLALVPLEAYKNRSQVIPLRAITIEDAPGFKFRGLHFDVGRNFQDKETVLRLLDLLATYKVNQLLFYTTEDEGWRIEIKDLPELTELGAHREHQSGYRNPGLHPGYGSGPAANMAGRHGSGFYTRADFVEILKYAKARHIHVIPELNFPGHARAAIKSMEARYEKLSKAGKQKEAEEFRLSDPNDSSKYISAQGYKDNVVDVTRPSVYHFYEKVMDELADMYREAGLTMDVIHMGGDEVATGAWTGSAAAVDLFNKNPSWETYKNFHAYFIRTILPALQKRKLRVDAWEEAALWYKKGGGYTVNPEFAGKITPYIWNNLYDPDLGYRMANAGYQVVLCNVTNFYFDMSYNNSPVEPGLYWAGFDDTWDAFAFDPYDMFHTTFTDAMGRPLSFRNVERLKPGARKNIIGVEAQIWSETIKGRDMLEYSTLPKLMGFAQSAWAMHRPWEEMADSAAREKVIQDQWNIFVNTLAARDLPRLSYLNGGYNYRVPPPGAVIEKGMLLANTAMPGLSIRYTTDGSEPGPGSALYSVPVNVQGAVRLRCFDAAGKASRSVELK